MWPRPDEPWGKPDCTVVTQISQGGMTHHCLLRDTRSPPCLCPNAGLEETDRNGEMELSGQSSEQKVRGMREQHRCSGPEAFVEKELSIARLKLNRHREVSGRSLKQKPGLLGLGQMSRTLWQKNDRLDSFKHVSFFSPRGLSQLPSGPPILHRGQRQWHSSYQLCHVIQGGLAV